MTGIRPAGAGDRFILYVVAAGLLAVFASPSRLYYLPFLGDAAYGAYLPPNIVDFAWAAVAAVVVLWARRIPIGPALAAVAIVALGTVGLVGRSRTVLVVDLVLVDLRLLSSLVIGSLVASLDVAPRILAAVFLAGTTLVAASTLYLLTAGGLGYGFYLEMRRFGALGLPPNSAAVLCAAAFNMVAVMSAQRVWSAAVAPFVLAASVATGSRAGMILALPGIALWLRFLMRGSSADGRGVSWTQRVIAVALMLAGAYWIIRQLAEFVTSGFLVSILTRVAETGTDVSWIGRIEIWGALVEFLARHPLAVIFGAGGGNAAVELALRETLHYSSLHAHNILLQILVSCGIVGLAVWARVWWPLFKGIPTSAPAELRALRLFGLTVLLGHIVDYPLYQAKMLLIVGTLLGFFWGWQKAGAKIEEKSTP